MQGREDGRVAGAGGQRCFHIVEDFPEAGGLGSGLAGVLGRQLLEGGGDLLLVDGLFRTAPTGLPGFRGLWSSGAEACSPGVFVAHSGVHRFRMRKSLRFDQSLGRANPVGANPGMTGRRGPAPGGVLGLAGGGGAPASVHV